MFVDHSSMRKHFHFHKSRDYACPECGKVCKIPQYFIPLKHDYTDGQTFLDMGRLERHTFTHSEETKFFVRSHQTLRELVCVCCAET